MFAVDMKGFGRAPCPADDDYGPETQARLVEAFVTRHDLRRITLMGHSLGGGVCLLTALALAESGRVERMVLLGAAAYRQRLPPFVALSRRPLLSRLLVRALGARRVIRWILKAIVYDARSIREDQVVEYARGLEGDDRLRATMAAGRSLLPDDVDEIVKAYRTLDVPTLLVWGDHERVVPAWVGDRLARELPDARLVVLERCGHLPQEERPDEAWEVVAHFLDERPLQHPA